MTTTVTLDIFSGRPNPEWNLAEGQVAALAEQILAALASPPLKERLTADGLGYRGFTVASDDSRIPRNVRVYRGVAAIGDASRAMPGMERFLLATAGDAIPPELRDDLRRELG